MKHLVATASNQAYTYVRIIVSDTLFRVYFSAGSDKMFIHENHRFRVKRIFTSRKYLTKIIHYTV